VLTVIASHIGCSTCFDSAYLAMRSKTLAMFRGAGVVPDLANGASMSALSELESFDMVLMCEKSSYSSFLIVGTATAAFG
jgi:hypothetical protein